MASDANEERVRAPSGGIAGLISADPLIVYAVPWHTPLGIAEALAARCSDRPVVFLLPTVWHCNARSAARIADGMQRFHASFPTHRAVVLGNTPQEVELLGAAGAEAIFSSQNIFVSEEVFRPAPDVSVEFDAIYNARPVPEKRHELAAEIERVAYVCSANPATATPEERAIVASLTARGPHHPMLNAVDDGLPVRMDPPSVNAALARAAVGLCLSAVEGANYASVEYMLAGLPIVSTPSLGGREVFFDPDYCLIVEPDPRSVRDAVEALRARGIPRHYVRERTLAKLTVERQRFLAFVEGIAEQRGMRRAYGTTWPFSDRPPNKWQTVEAHARDFFGK